MGHREDGAGVALEVVLEPLHRLGVQVVGGLVEQQQVGLLQQELAQCDATPLSTGEVVDECLRRRAAQGVHRLVELGVDVPRADGVEVVLQLAGLGAQGVVVGVGLGHLGVGGLQARHLGLDLGHRLLDVLEHRGALRERRLLLEHADARVGVAHEVAVVGVVEPGHQLQQRRLAHAVGTDDADLRPVQERERHVVEDDLVAVGLADVAERDYVVSHGASSLPRDPAAPVGRRVSPPPVSPGPRRRRRGSARTPGARPRRA